MRAKHKHYWYVTIWSDGKRKSTIPPGMPKNVAKDCQKRTQRANPGYDVRIESGNWDEEDGKVIFCRDRHAR